MYGTETYDPTVTETVDPAAANAAVAGILAFMGIFWLFFTILMVVMIVAQWKIFKKAGKPGWAAIIPIYNLIVLMEIVEKPVWWVALMFVPVANIIISILVTLELGKKFGKSDVFSIVGLILFPIVGYPMLAFGKAQYEGSGAVTMPAQPSPVAPEVTQPTDQAPLA